MNFLEIAQRVVRESGGISGSGPTTVVNQTGEYRNVVDWVNEVWRQIQTKHDNWRWMRASASMQTTIDQRQYSPTAVAPAGFGLTRFRGWWRDSFSIFETAVGVSDESALTWLTYDEYRNQYLFGTQQSSKPIHFTIDPQRNILLGPVPDKVYTLKGDYQKSAQALVADLDVPEIPDEQHMTIVYGALLKYARFDAAGELYEDADTNFKQGMRELTRNWLPPMEMYNETLVE